MYTHTHIPAVRSVARFSKKRVNHHLPRSCRVKFISRVSSPFVFVSFLPFFHLQAPLILSAYFSRVVHADGKPTSAVDDDRGIPVVLVFDLPFIHMCVCVFVLQNFRVAAKVGQFSLSSIVCAKLRHQDHRSDAFIAQTVDTFSRLPIVESCCESKQMWKMRVAFRSLSK